MFHFFFTDECSKLHFWVLKLPTVLLSVTTVLNIISFYFQLCRRIDSHWSIPSSRCHLLEPPAIKYSRQKKTVRNLLDLVTTVATHYSKRSPTLRLQMRAHFKILNYHQHLFQQHVVAQYMALIATVLETHAAPNAAPTELFQVITVVLLFSSI